MTPEERQEAVDAATRCRGYLGVEGKMARAVLSFDAALSAVEQERDEARRNLATPAPMYVVGLLDEHEFMRQLPPHDVTVYGPFWTIEQAQAHARTLSTDPDEGVVIEVAYPDGTLPGSNRVVAAEREVERLKAQLAADHAP